MKENSNKVLSFPSRVPAKADYQRVKSNYSIREIKQLFGLSERTIRRWTEQGIIQGTHGGKLSRLLTPFEEALLLHEQGDPKAAESYLEAISDGDNVAEAYCNLGIINKDLGAIGKALDNFTLSLKHEPRHVEAHYNLGNLYFDAGELPLARLHYEAAAQIEPGFSLVYFNLALVHYKLSDLAAALKALETYKQLRQPDDEEIDAVNQLLKAMQEPRNPIR